MLGHQCYLNIIGDKNNENKNIDPCENVEEIIRGENNGEDLSH